MESRPPPMRTLAPDFRIASHRLSPGVLAGVMLIHAGILAMILTRPSATQPVTPPAPLFVRLIEAAAVQPEPTPVPVRPMPAAPQPPRTQSVPRPPVLTTASPTPRPESPPIKETRRPEPSEPTRPESSRPETQPTPAPSPVTVEAPKSAPPPVLPLTQPRFNADYLDNPKPPYPGAARRMGEEGEVRLRVHVDAGGNPQQIEIFRSSGYPRLDQAALDTVKQWRFIPARQGDQPVPAWVIVPIQFSLRS